MVERGRAPHDPRPRQGQPRPPRRPAAHRRLPRPRQPDGAARSRRRGRVRVGASARGRSPAASRPPRARRSGRTSPRARRRSSGARFGIDRGDRDPDREAHPGHRRARRRQLRRGGGHPLPRARLRDPRRRGARRRSALEVGSDVPFFLGARAGVGGGARRARSRPPAVPPCTSSSSTRPTPRSRSVPATPTGGSTRRGRAEAASESRGAPARFEPRARRERPRGALPRARRRALDPPGSSCEPRRDGSYDVGQRSDGLRPVSRAGRAARGGRGSDRDGSGRSGAHGLRSADGATASEGGAMEITEVRVFPVNEEKLKAYVTITLDDCFVVRDLKVIQGNTGLFVAMPAKRRKDGTFKDIAHPLNQETRDRMERDHPGRVRARAAEGRRPARAAPIATTPDRADRGPPDPVGSVGPFRYRWRRRRLARRAVLYSSRDAQRTMHQRKRPDYRIFAGNSNRALAEAICKELGQAARRRPRSAGSPTARSRSRSARTSAGSTLHRPVDLARTRTRT